MIKIMPESGFCGGVKSAVNKANEQQNILANGGKVYLFGDLVNNDCVMRDFKEKGFEVTEDTNTILPGSTVVIRAHGVSKYVYETLSRNNVNIVDCTCQKIKNIHEIVEQKCQNGYRIFIIGKNKHPEVEGTVGWCSDGSVIVIEKDTILNDIDFTGKIYVVAQTTYGRELWNKITGTIRTKNTSAEIEDTLCPVTDRREQEAKNFSKSVNVMIVIGGKGSSNSIELYNVCKSFCKDTFFVDSLENLDGNAIAKKAVSSASVIGVAGSASTPASVIEDIFGYLSFLEFLGEAKKEIEKKSDEYFEELVSAAVDNKFIIDSLNSLYEQNKGGKRIRGAMIKLGEQIASSGSSNNYLPIAVGYEIFQTAILVHDDIIDKSKMRRSRMTIHVETAGEMKKQNGVSDIAAEHFGMSRALCIGDYGFFIAYQILSECNIDSSILTNIFKVYSQILSKTCEGEIMDVILPYKNIPITDNYDEYRHIVTQIFEFKTAWYTLAGPIMLGAICGGANDELVDLLKNITIPLGVAFQIKDDLLGIYSNEEVLGKPLLSDIKEKKQTLLYGYALKNADENDKNLLKQHYGNENANMHDLEIIKHIFEITGAKKYSENEIQRLSETSKKLMDNPLINDKYRVLLNGLISYLITRKF
jgi:4-hydroxy-3-methylbut-2-enyl diphosphate reductase